MTGEEALRGCSGGEEEKVVAAAVVEEEEEEEEEEEWADKVCFCRRPLRQ